MGAAAHLAWMTLFRRARPPRPKPRLEGVLKKWQHVLPELEYLVHATGDYIVFLDRELDVDWETTLEYDGMGHPDETLFNRVRNQVALLESTPCAEIPRDMKEQFKRLVAEGMDRALAHDYPGAESILQVASEYIIGRSHETSRCWYLTASTVMTVPFIVIGASLWICRAMVITVIGETPFWLAIATVAGTLGALLSVIGRTGKLQFDCSSGRWLHYLEGSSRVWAGALSGLFVGLAVRSGLVLTALTRGGRVPAIMILAAMASGAGERLANSIIADLGSTKSETLKHGTSHEASSADNR